MRKTTVEIIMVGDEPCVENSIDMLLDSLFVVDLKGCTVRIGNEVIKDDA